MEQKRYADLGKLLCAEYPDVARQLNAKLLKGVPVLTDQCFIDDFFEAYCLFKNISPSEITGQGRQKTYHKHVFITAIVKLYSPNSLTQAKRILPKNLRKNLSEILETKGERISEAICSARVRLKAYEDFNTEVEAFYRETINKLYENNYIKEIRDFGERAES